jgi:hypothetical protein
VSGLYKLSVGISLKDTTAPGFATLERNAKATQEKTDSLRKSLEALGKGFDPQHSLASQSKILEYTERQVALRKEMAVTTDAGDRTRIATELEALSLAKQEETLRKSQLTLQERLGKLQDTTAYQAQASQEKLTQQTLRNQDMVAGVALRNQETLARAAYAAQVEQERVDLRNIKVIADAKKASLRETARQQASASSSYGLAAGMAAGAAGGGILHGLGSGLSGATDMQTALVTMKVATHATGAQIEQLRSLAFDISNLTGQSATDAAKNLAIVAGSGINKIDQLVAIATPIAQFADVQFYKNKTPFEDSARQGVQLAHLFGAFDEKKMSGILNELTKVSFAMPDNLSRFLTQATYYVPFFQGAGVSSKDTLEAGAIMDRIGMGRGKGGSSLGNIILQQMKSLAQTGHVQKARQAGLQLLGLADKKGDSSFFKWDEKTRKGKFDIIGALLQIDKSVKQIPAGLHGKEALQYELKHLAAVNAALGLTGERASLAITPEAIAGIMDSLHRIGMSGGMKDIQPMYMGTLGAQEQRFKSNMDSLLTDLMWPWLDQLRGGFKWMGDEAHEFQVWAHTHKDAAKMISGGLAGIGVSLALYSGAQLWGVASGLSGLSKSIKLLGSSSVLAGGEVATAEVGIGSGAKILGIGLGALGRVSLLLGAIAGLDYFVEHGIPNFEKYRKEHPNSGPSYVERESSQFAAAESAYRASQSGGIHIHGNVVVHGTDAKSQAKAFLNHVQSASRGPVSNVNVKYSASF